MLWIAGIAMFVVVLVVYVMAINRSFLRCPHCSKIGSWRFDNLGESKDEYDDDECLIQSTTRQTCRKCGGEVVHIWSDNEGRQIRSD